MIKKTITISLLLMSSLVLAASGLRFESIEVKVTQIDLVAQTVSYVENNAPKTLKIDEEVMNDGFYISARKTKELKSIMLNKKYFLRIAHTNSNNKEIPESYVSFISSVPYDTLY